MIILLLYIGLIVITSISILYFAKYFDHEEEIHVSEKFLGGFEKDSLPERGFITSETPGYIYMSNLEKDDFERMRVREQMRVLPDYVDQFTS